MSEKDLVELWNDKRKQIIAAQFHSVVAIAVITVVALMGLFEGAYTYAISFAATFLVTVGALSVLNQFAIIREARSLVKDISSIENPSHVAKDIAKSGGYLNYTLGILVVFSAALLVAFILILL
jgi:glucan phosphoethanolaminetransferase (alkaline phosphatase superfamily)